MCEIFLFATEEIKHKIQIPAIIVKHIKSTMCPIVSIVVQIGF